MEITETRLPGVLLLRPTPYRDDRGVFTRTFDAALAAEHGIDLGPVAQDSQSRSRPGVLRGMHTRGGAGEAKLVRCSAGRVLDMIVDGRPQSPTFGDHLAVELDDESFVAVWIPAGMLHGFQVLSDTAADVCYRIDTPHDPTEDLAVRWDDPDLALPWRRDLPIEVSDRDAGAGTWAAFAAGVRSGMAGAEAGHQRNRSDSSS